MGFQGIEQDAFGRVRPVQKIGFLPSSINKLAVTTINFGEELKSDFYEPISHRGYSLYYSERLKELPLPLQKQIAPVVNQVDFEKMPRYEASNAYGVIEEAADTLFELYKLKALREGLLSETTLQQVASLQKTLGESNASYDELASVLLEKLGSEKLGTKSNLAGRF